MTTTAYDMPQRYAWAGTRSRRRTAVRVAKLVATLLALVPTIGFAAMLGGGMNANVMVSGSMEPKIDVGSLLLYETVSADALRRGDVISFARPGSDSAVTTHRIVDIARSEGKPVFQTKGDNNAIADPWLVRYEAGEEPRRLAHVLPYVGHLVRAAQGPFVRISLLVLVLGWIYLSFLRALARGSNGKPEDATFAAPASGTAKPQEAAAAAPTREAAGAAVIPTSRPGARSHDGNRIRTHDARRQTKLVKRRALVRAGVGADRHP